MLKGIAVILALAIAGILTYTAMQPDSFTYSRSIVINAPAEKVFPYINDFKSWTSWSPYEKKDLTMKRMYGATTIGEGATYAWDGNDEVGAGRMMITETNEPSRILIRLEFMRPFAAVNSAEFMLRPVDFGTEVSWVMSGPATFVSKIMCLFFDVDAMIGKDFDAGLAELKRVSEAG
jgi:uncharacterized protein YndB with AHSA1/START domain